MADRTVNQLQVCVYGFLPYISYLVGVAYALNVLIRTEFKIYLVCVVDGFLCKLLTDKLGERSADLARQPQLAVRECACALKARCDMAVGLTVHTVLCFCLRTAPFLYRSALFDYQNFFV